MSEYKINQTHLHETPMYSPSHHALLFAWIAQEIIKTAGEERGGAVLEKAVCRYAMQRGKRMALRAQRDGFPRDMFAFMVYGEWQAAPGETVTKVNRVGKDVMVQVIQCAWYQAWEKAGLESEGKFYCAAIDAGLAQGFNPSLPFDVRGIRPHTGKPCEFVYHGANLNGLNLLRYWFAKRFRPGNSAIMPWEYHIGHLYKTLREVIIEELGIEGEKAVDAGLDHFSAMFGKDITRVIAQYQLVDFNHLP
jgi:hypothetical protein